MKNQKKINKKYLNLLVLSLSIALTTPLLKAQQDSETSQDLGNGFKLIMVDSIGTKTHLATQIADFDKIVINFDLKNIDPNLTSTDTIINLNPLRVQSDLKNKMNSTDSTINTLLSDISENQPGQIYYLARRVLETKLPYNETFEQKLKNRDIQPFIFPKAGINCLNNKFYCTAVQKVDMGLSSWDVKYKILYQVMEKEELYKSFSTAKNLIEDPWLDQAQLGFVQTTFAWDQIFTFGVNIVLVTKDNEGFLNLVTYQIFKLKDNRFVGATPNVILQGKIREAISQQIDDLKSYLEKTSQK